MIPLTLAEVAGAVGGELVDLPAGQTGGDLVVTGPVVVDSRRVAPGALFVALPGERADGHDFAAAAVAAGAAGVLAARPVGVPAVVVADGLEALGRLATAVLERLPDVVVVGLTGSSGKTSTKDLLAQVLAGLGPTVAPPGSYNNEVGMPLTVLQADASTRHLVLELGARGRGHIRYLTEIARPRVGLVLNVGTAHVGEFGSRAAIAAAKSELPAALPAAAAGGLAVLNADDPLVAAMAQVTSARTVTFGETPPADVRATDVALDELGRARFTLHAAGGSTPVRLRTYGGHQVSNALAAAAVALELGMSRDDVAAALGEATARSRWRMEVSTRADGTTIVNDAYNANPESMRAALKALVDLASTSASTSAPSVADGAAGTVRRTRHTWAVLGEMRELGDASADEHDAVGRLAVRLDVSRLVVVGAAAKPMHLGAVLEGSWSNESEFVPDVDAAVALLRAQVQPGDVVLVKASRAAGLERVAEALLQDPPVGDERPVACG